MKKKITILLILFSFLLLTLFSISIWSPSTDGNTRVFGHELYIVKSGSMEPKIKTGSLIAIETNSDTKKTYEIGDVITYQSVENLDTLITHRIVGVKEGDILAYVTKGDNNKSVDPVPIPAQNVRGNYTDFTVPYIGYAIAFLASTPGIISFIIIPGFLSLILALAYLYQEVKLLQKEKKRWNNHQTVIQHFKDMKDIKCS